MTIALPGICKSYSSSVALLFLLMTIVCFSPLSIAAINPVEPLRSVNLTIEDVKVGAGEEFVVVLNISDVNGLEITAFNLALFYDASLVTALSASIEGTLSGPNEAEMTLAYNAAEAGRIAIAAAGVKAIAGAGSLLVITFQSLSEDGVASMEFDQIILNEGNPVAIGNSGSIVVSSALPGDASLNGEVSAFDAAKVLQHAAFIDTLATPAFLAADVTGNNEVSSYDAALILQHVSGLISCFPVEELCEASKNASSKSKSSENRGSENTASTQVDFSWGTALPDGMKVYIPLIINKLQGDVQAITIEIMASEGVDFASDMKAKLPKGWIAAHRKNDQGTLRITMAGLTPLTSDTLLVLQTGNRAITLDAYVQINEEKLFDLETFSHQSLPTSFTLMQNYPNPFNPTTTIRYALQEDIRVSLIIYDVLGREVGRLVDGPQAAGTHAIPFDAQALSSGVYVYRLEAGAFSQTRQMMLLK